MKKNLIKFLSVILIILLLFTNIITYAADNTEKDETKTETNEISSEDNKKIDEDEKDKIKKEEKKEADPLKTINIQRSYKNPPGTFYDYSFLTSDFINMIKANLVVSESFTEMEDNFRKGNMNKFEEDYIDAIKFIKNDRTLSESDRKKFLDKIDTPDVKWIVSHVLAGITKMEHGGDTKANPGNLQGVFQLYAIQKCGFEGICGSGFTRSRLYYTPQSKYSQVYARNKILSRTDYLYQFIDILYFLSGEKGISSRFRQLLGKGTAINYREQLDVIFRALNDTLKLTTKEKEELIIDIIRKDTEKLGSFILNNKEKLYQYGITKPEDLIVFMEYIKVATVGNIYNGWANNMTYRINGFNYPGFNLFDNSYVSNLEEYGFCFHAISHDGGKLDSTHLGQGLIYYYIEYNYPNDKKIKQGTFAAIIGKMIKKNLTRVHALKCR